MAYQTIDQLTAAGYTLHHTAAARGYISRRSEGVIRDHSGKFGVGYAVHTPRRDTTNYHYISYYTREA